MNDCRLRVSYVMGFHQRIDPMQCMSLKLSYPTALLDWHTRTTIAVSSARCG